MSLPIRAPIKLSDQWQNPWRLALLIRIWPILLISILMGLFFWDAWFAGRVFLMRDSFCDFVPYRLLEKRALWSGNFPVWNPYSGCGQTFLGDPQAGGALYPLHIVFYLLPVTLALRLSLYMHMCIAAAGMYWFNRRWLTSRCAAVLGGLCYATGTYFVAWEEYQSAMCVLAWVPWVLFIASTIAQRDSRHERRLPRPALLAGLPQILTLTLVLTVQYLAGHAEHLTFCAYIYLLFTIIAIPIRFGLRAAIRTILSGVTAIILAVGLTAVDWLMVLQRIALSARTSTFDPRVSMASLYPTHWLTLLLPFLFGRPGYPDKLWDRTLYEFFLGTSYIGLLPIILAIVAIATGWRAKRRERGLWLAMIVLLILGVLLASGQYTPTFGFFNRHIIGFTRMRWPAKLVIWVNFALCELAAIGAQRILMSHPATLVRWVRRGAVLVAIILSGAMACCCLTALSDGTSTHLFTALTFNLAAPTHERIADLAHQLAMASVFSAVSAVAFICCCKVARPLRRRLAPTLILACAFIDLSYNARQVHPIGPASLYDMPSPAMRDRATGLGPLDRVYSSYSVQQQFLYADPNISRWKAAQLDAIGNTWLSMNVGQAWAGGLTITNYAQAFAAISRLDQTRAQRLLDVMAVTNAITPSGNRALFDDGYFEAGRMSARPTASPRALIVPYWVVEKDFQHAVSWILDPQVNPSEIVVLESPSDGRPEPAPPDLSPLTVSRPARTIVRSVKEGWNRCDINVTCDTTAMLLLNDAYFPGWTATVDGHDKPIYRANLLFRGVQLDPGSQHIVFRFIPWQLICGTLISVTTLAAIGAAIFLKYKLHRRARFRDWKP